MALNILFLPFLQQEIMRFQFVFLLLVLLSASVLLQNANTPPGYQKFENQHIYKKMSADACDKVMQTRHISNLSNNECKVINTFVKAKASEVRSICKGGKKYETISREHFDLVVCELKEQSTSTKPHKCHYIGHEKLQKRIIIMCEEGYPVHYDGDLKHCDN